LNELEQNIENLNPIFSSKISKTNIHNNYLEISRFVSRSDFTEAHIDFLLNRCQVVTFTLSNVSEAFQFFDSQNARGRDLDPHDLLKAYHLREFSVSDGHLKASTVANWENSDAEELVAYSLSICTASGGGQKAIRHATLARTIRVCSKA